MFGLIVDSKMLQTLRILNTHQFESVISRILSILTHLAVDSTLACLQTHVTRALPKFWLQICL